MGARRDQHFVQAWIGLDPTKLEAPPKQRSMKAKKRSGFEAQNVPHFVEPEGINYFNSCEILLAVGLSRLQGGWDFNIFPPTQILDDFKNLQCYLGSGHIALQFPQ